VAHTVTTDDGVDIGYDQFGPADGTVVVLCHGICAGRRQFSADGAYFAALGYRVLVPDLRGHGASGMPAGYRAADFSIARLAADMLAVLDDAGATTVHWVGNSLGGIVGLELLGAAPRRFRSFATFGTSYRLSVPALAPPLLPLLYRVPGRRALAAITAWMTTADPAARTLIAEMIAAFDPQAGHAIVENLRRYDLLANALAFEGPLLLLRGGRDRAVNAALGSTLSAMTGRSNFSRIDLPRAGHCANLDVPDELRTILVEFWQGAGRPPIPVRQLPGATA
jgi:pimeloyl-ACP methyl ester carboxylesterase